MRAPAGSEPTITVLIVAYQHERYIAECIESVLAQEVDGRMEVLIGEDGSKDDTLAICQRYAADPRVQVIARGKDQQKIRIDGYPTGRANLLDLMRQASGTFVTRIDGDDKWTDPHKLRIQLDALRAHPEAIGCYHQTERIAADGSVTGRMFRDNLPERMGLDDTIAHLSPFHISSFVYRNLPALRDLPPLARSVGSLDLLLFALAADKGPLIRVDGAMSAYREHDEGITRKGLFAGTNNLRLRILLWTGVVGLLHGKGKAKAFRVCDDHLHAALREPIDRADAKRWAKALLARPGYFLSSRMRFMQWLRIVRKGRRTGAV